MNPLDRRPWFIRFDLKAWLTDAALRSCVPAARGVWIDLIALAGLSDRPGYLSRGGVAMTVKELQVKTGIEMRLLERSIHQLEAAGVFSRTAEGVIFSRRMVRDLAETELARVHGKEGGNPALNGKKTGKTGAKKPPGIRTDSARTPHGIRTESGPLQPGMTLVRVFNGLQEEPLKGGVKLESESESESESKREKRRAAVLPREAEAAAEAEASEASTNVVPFELGAPTAVEPAPAKPKRKSRSAEPEGPYHRQGVERTPPKGNAELIAMEDEALMLWNRLAAMTVLLPGTMTGERRKLLRARLRECGGIEGWHKMLAKAEHSPLLQGKAGNIGYRWGFSDVIGQEKFWRLMEGSYDDHARPAPVPKNAASQRDANVANLLRRAGVQGRATANGSDGVVLDAEAAD